MIIDRKLVYESSVKLGFITGEENREHKEAYITSAIIVAEPYSTEGAFDFGNQNL